MNTEITDSNARKPAGWVFYDWECAFCRRGARLLGGLFVRRGFFWLPFQTPGTPQRLGLSESALQVEMKLLLADGRVAGGVDAWVILLRSVWWLWPVGVLLGLPGFHWFGERTYRWIAGHRYYFAGPCQNEKCGKGHHRHSAFFEMP